KKTEHGAIKRRRQSDGHPAGQFRGKGQHFRTRARHVAHDRLAQFVEALAGDGRDDTLRVALKQRDAELVFETAELHAQGRLSDVLFLARFGEITRVIDTQEIDDLTQIHPAGSFTPQLGIRPTTTRWPKTAATRTFIYAALQRVFPAR